MLVQEESTVQQLRFFFRLSLSSLFIKVQKKVHSIEHFQMPKKSFLLEMVA
jgi:hypothetical protein